MRGPLIVVKEDDCEKIFHEMHNHSGRTKCWDRIKARYYWYGCEKYVRQQTRECTTCFQTNAYHTKAQISPLLPIAVIPKMMWRVHLDLAGPFELSPFGNKYVAIGICAFTKYVEAMGN